MQSTIEVLSDLNDTIEGYLHWLEYNKKYEKSSALQEAFSVVSNYNFDYDPYSLFAEQDIDDNDAINRLSNIIEIGSNRKKNGVYYTPKDITKYMVYNAVYKFLSDENTVHDINQSKESILSLDDSDLLNFCTNTKLLDPTSGAGEFTFTAMTLKIDILKYLNELSEKRVLSVVSTIFNNDISCNATLASKYRILIFLSNILTKSNLIKAAKILNDNNSNYDFIYSYDKIKFRNIDIIIGNPPYVEYRNLSKTPNIYYGNAYANVLDNSIHLLSNNGMMSYVIPISFTSTPRMGKIRELITKKFSNLVILSFSDRPDSLFQRVHQKLNIIFASNYNYNETDCNVLTSAYHYWYKFERNSLFSRINITNNNNINSQFIPKYGNNLQKSIFNKIQNIKDGKKLNELIINSKDINSSDIFLGLRCSFFVKAFVKYPSSKEYKGFKVNGLDKLVVISLLNSSLFWTYWVAVSDGWHITKKELDNFYVPNISSESKKSLNRLGSKLLKRLEDTKEYIGSVQTDYEYKHKYAMDIIDDIDEVLAKEYKFNKLELKEIISFARKYREGKKND